MTGCFFFFFFGLLDRRWGRKLTSFLTVWQRADLSQAASALQAQMFGSDAGGRRARTLVTSLFKSMLYPHRRRMKELGATEPGIIFYLLCPSRGLCACGWRNGQTGTKATTTVRPARLLSSASPVNWLRHEDAR